MRKKLKKKIDLFLSLAIIVVLLPLLLTIFMQKMKLETLLAGNQDAFVEGIWTTELTGENMSATPEPNVENATGTSEPKAENTTEALTSENVPETAAAETSYIEEQLLGVVAKEINVGVSREALLAQCVIARTNFYDAKNAGMAEPETLKIEEMHNLWGENFDEAYQLLRECIELTKNQILTWEGKPIYAAYHAISAGKTRNIKELYADAQMPYLVECACGKDTSAEDYLEVNYWEEQEFVAKCQEAFSGNGIEASSEIFVLSRDTADYVKEVQVGTGTCTGEEFRNIFGLNSACFSVNNVDGKVRIVTRGVGHGVGLSQHTANLMAVDGKGYEEILMYFYPGAELTGVTKK